MMFAQLLLLALGPVCLTCQETCGGHVLDVHGLYLMPDMSRSSRSLLAKLDERFVFNPFAAETYQRRRLRQLPGVFVLNDAARARLERRSAVMRLLHSLFRLVRVPTTWTVDGEPDSFSERLDKRLQLNVDFWNCDFPVEYGMSHCMSQLWTPVG